MIVISRARVLLTAAFLVMGPLGWFFGKDSNPAEGARLLIISAPLLYAANLTWKSLKPQNIGTIKFVIAHALPIAMAIPGLIFIFAPKAVPVFISSGVILVLAAGVVITHMHRQRKILKNSAQ